MPNPHIRRSSRPSPRGVSAARALGALRRLQFEELERRLLLATFTVTSNADSGAGTLRQAIIDSNTTAGAPHSITFAIPPLSTRIQPTTPLPAILQAVVIDGYTQGGAEANSNGTEQGLNSLLRIELDLSSLGTDESGLTLAGSNITVRGLNINREPPSPAAAVGNLTAIRITGNDNRIEGNFIGTNAAGTAVRGTGLYGIRISGDRNVIGGELPAARNLISGNFGDDNFGLTIISGGEDNRVQGNLIGTNLSGMVALGNDSGGILSDGGRNQIGGLLAAHRNIISGHVVFGIALRGNDDVVQGNFIGTDVTGVSALGNGTGVGIDGLRNIIGGTSPGEGNRIAFNLGDGALVANGTRNSIRGNSIHANGGLGIDLLDSLGQPGVTPNDSGSFPDSDSGGNELQNFPSITRAFSRSGRIQGQVFSTPNSDFLVDFYASAAADPSGFGEGQRYLGARPVRTGSDGIGNFDFADFPAGTFSTADRLTATATDSLGNTSEFSASVESLPLASINDVTVLEGDSGDTNAVFTVTLSRPAPSGFLFFLDYQDESATQNDADYRQRFPPTLFVSAGNTSATFAVPVVGDTKTERDETFHLVLFSDAVEVVNSGRATIRNDDQTKVFIDDASIAEGDEGQTGLVFTIRKDNPVDAAISMLFGTVEVDTLPMNRATAGQDYESRVVPITLPADQTSIQVAVPINGDRVLELDEEFLVELTQLSADARDVVFGDASATGIVDNDDRATISRASATVVEGLFGKTELVLTIVMNAVSDADVDFLVQTADFTATDLRDYDSFNDRVTILAGTTSTQITLMINGDNVVELDEEFVIRLSDLKAGERDIALADTASIVTIDNDDRAVLSVAGVTQVEGNSGTTEFVFTLTLSNPVDAGVAVQALTVQDSAVAGRDYLALARDFLIPAGETTARVVVQVLADDLREPDNAFFLELSRLNSSGRDVVFSNGSLDPLTATGLILNDDILPIIITEPSEPLGPDKPVSKPELPPTPPRPSPIASFGVRPSSQIMLGGGWFPYQPKPPGVPEEVAGNDGQVQRVTKTSPKSVEDSAMLLYGADADQPRLLSIDYGDPPPRPASLESETPAPSLNRVAGAPDPTQREVLKPSLEPDAADVVAPNWRTPALWGSLAGLLTVGWLIFDRRRARDRKTV